jgi:hypothetical protein
MRLEVLPTKRAGYDHNLHSSECLFFAPVELWQKHIRGNLILASRALKARVSL